MKIVLFIVGLLILAGTLLVTSVNDILVEAGHKSAGSGLGAFAGFLIGTICLCTAAVIQAIQTAAHDIKPPPPPDFRDGLGKPVEFFDEQGRRHVVSAARMANDKK
jgi:hypothetical protein